MNNLAVNNQTGKNLVSEEQVGEVEIIIQNDEDALQLVVNMQLLQLSLVHFHSN